MRDDSSVKILMIGWEFPPHSTGGLGFACLGLADALSQKSVDLTFVLPRKIDISFPNIKFRFAEIPHMKTEGMEGLHSGYITSKQYDEIVKRVGEHGLTGSTLLEEVSEYAARVKRIALEEDFDVIHAHDWLSMLAGVAAKEASGKPLIVHVHATSFDQSGGDNVNPATYAIEKHGMEKADVVIAVSDYTKNMIVNKYGIDPNKIRVVHNGVLREALPMSSQMTDIMSFKQAGFNIVLFIGRITIQKGVDYFLRAAQKALAYEPDTVFIVAGTGDMQNQIIREAAALGIADKVLFLTKFVGPEEKAALFGAADLFVMPSVSEPFGLVPLEALLEGNTPVIISKQSGVAEVLSNALRVDFWDTDEMANKIVAVLRHGPLAQQLTNYGREEAEGITWHKAAEKVVSIYHEIVHFFKAKA